MQRKILFCITVQGILCVPVGKFLVSRNRVPCKFSFHFPLVYFWPRGSVAACFWSEVWSELWCELWCSGGAAGVGIGASAKHLCIVLEADACLCPWLAHCCSPATGFCGHVLPSTAASDCTGAARRVGAGSTSRVTSVTCHAHSRTVPQQNARRFLLSEGGVGCCTTAAY